MKKQFLTLEIQCKPLVKRYLESNFGTPVTIPDEHILNKLACSQLVKKNSRNDDFKPYPERVQLAIGWRNFVYDGFSINPDNTANFNNAVDGYIKDLAHISIDGILIAKEKMFNWKERHLNLLKYSTVNFASDKAIKKEIRRIKSELEPFQLDIKQAIDIVVYDFLKIDFDVLPYETIRKSYYRYSLRKVSDDDKRLRPVSAA